MRLIRHKRNKDTAFQILELFPRRKALVSFYNINYNRISGLPPLYMGYGLIRLDPNTKNYSVIYTK